MKRKKKQILDKSASIFGRKIGTEFLLKIVNKKIGSIKKRSEKSLNLDLANTIKEIYLQMLIINTADTIIKRKNIPPIRLPMSTLKSIAKSIVSKCDIGDNENNKGFKDFLETIILSILRIVNF
jgi:hypothetical protein